ncbi:MAG TPA: FAD-dependent oxidoreductase [Verrucomicrobiae bacterium]|nr:FAD-dependent oxidoreductase [Verrucomicrobiae bacterium]
MTKVTLTLREKKEIAAGTMAFCFGSDGQRFVFKPGQCIRITLLDPLYKDKKGNARDFSIASSPGDPSLMIATRMTGSAFKRSLADLPVGSSVRVNGPYGEFLHDVDPVRPAIFLAGGIGITPFRSMIKHAMEQHSTQRLTLVYCNRTPDDAAFLDELQDWEKENPNFRVIATMTQPQNPGKTWTGRTGYVGVRFVKEHLCEQTPSVYCVAGPPRFVSAVAEVLAIAGVNEGDIRTDEFFGYEA